MAALSSFIVTRNDRYAHDCRDRAAVYKMAAPLNTCTTIEKRSVVRFFFCGEKLWQQRISTKKCWPSTVNIACHVKQPIIGCKSYRKGEKYRRRTSRRSAVCEWFRQQPQKFYTAGFQGLMKRWGKCLNF